jgi:leucyl aminopeptidase
MNLNSSLVDIASHRADCAVVAVHENRKLSASAQALDASWNGQIARVIKRGDLSGKIGQTLVLHGDASAPQGRVVLVGAGKSREVSVRDFGRLAAALAAALSKLAIKSVVVDLATMAVAERDEAWRVRNLAEAILDSTYHFDAMKSGPKAKTRGPKKITFARSVQRASRTITEALARASAIHQGKCIARDLGNLPGNICTPRYLAAHARKMATGSTKLKSQVLTEKELTKLGMGSFLSVAQGSAEPPRLITLEYNGGDSDRRPVVLVGKGVTFDSGGISLKPGATMDEMKFDMCGAASVIGAITALEAMAAPVNVVGVIVATENMPSSTAVKPGDVVTTMAGKTVEILNTDAEGRLILCDALTYAERFEPDVVVDIATLTGACMVALGQVASGLFSNDDNLANALERAGDATGDRVWRLPVWEEYQDQLASNFADFANIGGRFAGAVTAACFLARFATEQRWAHLDIAGTAWRSGGAKGATGRPVPLLTEFVLEHGNGRKRSRA